MTIKDVICDMDGVLVDSEPIHQERIRQFFAEHGFEVPTEQLVTLVGCSGSYFDQKAAEWWAQVPRQGLCNETPDVLTTYSRWKDRHGEIDYRPLVNPGVPETLERLSAKGIRLAVASSTSHEGIQQELGPSDLLRHFEIIVNGDEFSESKPNPPKSTSPPWRGWGWDQMSA